MLDGIVKVSRICAYTSFTLGMIVTSAVQLVIADKQWGIFDDEEKKDENEVHSDAERDQTMD